MHTTILIDGCKLNLPYTVARGRVQIQVKMCDKQNDKHKNGQNKQIVN